MMNKKNALVLFVFFDLLGVVILWLGYNILNKFFFEINHHVEVIEFSSRAGFFTVGAPIIIIHIIAIIEYFYPELIKKHLKILNVTGIIALLFFLSSGFCISSIMESRVENAGYVYCRNASGVSALAKTLVYTKNMDICEALVAAKAKLRN